MADSAASARLRAHRIMTLRRSSWGKSANGNRGGDGILMGLAMAMYLHNFCAKDGRTN
jgi:hypothetical protein